MMLIGSTGRNCCSLITAIGQGARGLGFKDGENLRHSWSLSGLFESSRCPSILQYVILSSSGQSFDRPLLEQSLPVGQ